MPLVEVFRNSPLLCVQLHGVGPAALGTPVAAWCGWLHALHTSVDQVVASAGVSLCQAQPLGQQGTLLFCTAPGPPPDEQGAVLVALAQALVATAAGHRLPTTGLPVDAHATLHAGSYAGAIIGELALRYE